MKEWRPLQTSVELQDGIDAHALLAGKPAPTASARAQWFAARLTRAGQQYKLVPGRREVYQRVQWQGFVLKRIIDQYAYDHLTPVLIDWKTGTWPWDAIDGIYPKALTFQSAIYLLPPSLPRAAAPFKKWPERIDFVTAPEKGTVTPFAVYRDEDDERNLLQAVEQVAEARRFPRNRGFNCKYCDFFWKCFGIEQESGKHYERRTSFVPLEEL